MVIKKNIQIKDLYKKIIKTKYQNNYEFNRWFIKSSLRSDFFMTHNSIQFLLKNVNFNNCIELGPGPGTWTKLLFRQNQKAKFDLIDISEEMKKQFELEMRMQPNINYILTDFLKYKFNKTYDLFFSSRALEYLNNKEECIKRISKVLKKGGTGIIITKLPSNKKQKRFQHTGQIAPKKLKELLKQNNFKDIKIYPVIIRVPFFHHIIPYFSELIYKQKFNEPLKNKRLCESYAITFKK